MGGFSGVREELVAAADLTRLGYEVFAPILGYHTSCDLIAIRRAPDGVGAPIRIEVKRCVFTQQRADDTGPMFSNAPAPHKRDFHDVVAYVLTSDNDRVIYHPPLPAHETLRKAA